MYRAILTERVPPCHDDCDGTQDDQDCQICHARRECDAHRCNDCDWSHDCTQAVREVHVSFFNVTV